MVGQRHSLLISNNPVDSFCDPNIAPDRTCKSLSNRSVVRHASAIPKEDSIQTQYYRPFDLSKYVFLFDFSYRTRYETSKNSH